MFYFCAEQLRTFWMEVGERASKWVSGRANGRANGQADRGTFDNSRKAAETLLSPSQPPLLLPPLGWPLGVGHGPRHIADSVGSWHRADALPHRSHVRREVKCAQRFSATRAPGRQPNCPASQRQDANNCSACKTVRVWSSDTGHCLHTFHAGASTSATAATVAGRASPDGGSMGSDASRRAAPPRGAGAAVSAVSCAGEWLASGAGATLRLHHLPTRRLVWSSTAGASTKQVASVLLVCGARPGPCQDGFTPPSPLPLVLVSAWSDGEVRCHSLNLDGTGLPGALRASESLKWITSARTWRASIGPAGRRDGRCSGGPHGLGRGSIPGVTKRRR
ncbi:unnamed protein product [Lampetra planeri]